MNFPRCLFFVAVAILPASAETAHVTLSNTGCVGRQLAVKQLWEKIPDVISVSVLPPSPENHGTQRVFVIVSKGKAPDAESLRAALARRADQYPLVKWEIAAGRGNNALGQFRSRRLPQRREFLA